MGLVIYLLIRLLSILFQILPHSSVLRLGSALGAVCYRVLGGRREITLVNLRRSLGSQYHEDHLQEIALESFRELGKTFAEFLCFPKWVRHGLHRYVTVRGASHVQQAMSAGKGAIVFIGHIGNWELQALVYGQLLSHPSAIAFPLKNQRLNDWVNECRGLTGLEVIPKYQAARQVFRHLRANHAVGFIADQNAGREGVFVDLFGTLASSSRGPVTFALKTGAPILISLDERRPDGHHVLSISEPFYPESTGNLESDVLTNTQFLMKSLESAIRRNPGQWMWMHDRWKSRPDKAWLIQRARRKGYETVIVE